MSRQSPPENPYLEQHNPPGQRVPLLSRLQWPKFGRDRTLAGVPSLAELSKRDTDSSQFSYFWNERYHGFWESHREEIRSLTTGTAISRETWEEFAALIPRRLGVTVKTELVPNKEDFLAIHHLLNFRYAVPGGDFLLSDTQGIGSGVGRIVKKITRQYLGLPYTLYFVQPTSGVAHPLASTGGRHPPYAQIVGGDVYKNKAQLDSQHIRRMHRDSGWSFHLHESSLAIPGAQDNLAKIETLTKNLAKSIATPDFYIDPQEEYHAAIREEEDHVRALRFLDLLARDTPDGFTHRSCIVKPQSSMMYAVGLLDVLSHSTELPAELQTLGTPQVYSAPLEIRAALKELTRVASGQVSLLTALSYLVAFNNPTESPSSCMRELDSPYAITYYQLAMSLVDGIEPEAIIGKKALARRATDIYKSTFYSPQEEIDLLSCGNPIEVAAAVVATMPRGTRCSQQSLLSQTMRFPYPVSRDINDMGIVFLGLNELIEREFHVDHLRGQLTKR